MASKCSHLGCDRFINLEICQNGLCPRHTTELEDAIEAEMIDMDNEYQPFEESWSETHNEWEEEE